MWLDTGFSKGLDDKFTYKSSPKISWLFGLFEKPCFLSKSYCNNFLGNFWKKIKIFLLQHLVPLVYTLLHIWIWRILCGTNCNQQFISVSGLDRVISLVATETQTILVYENTSLKWASQLPFVPMAMQRGTFQVIICMSSLKGEEVIVIYNSTSCVPSNSHFQSPTKAPVCGYLKLFDNVVVKATHLEFVNS